MNPLQRTFLFLSGQERRLIDLVKKGENVGQQDVAPLNNQGGQSSVEYDTPSYHRFLSKTVHGYSATTVEDILDGVSNGQWLNGQKTMTMLSYLDADVSQALSNILLLGNTDMKLEAFIPGTDFSKHDTRAEKLLQAFINDMRPMRGGIRGLNSQLFQTAYLQGAIAMEVVPDESGRAPKTITPVNPFTLQMKLEGDTLIPYQEQGSNAEVRLNEETFVFVPIDSAIGEWTGRPMVSAAIGEVLFNLRLLYDLRRVIHSQGWPRFDVQILTQVITDTAPESMKANPAKLKEYVQQVVDQFRKDYRNIKPDDAFVHTDGVKVTGVSGGQGSFDPNVVILTMERRIFRALKMLPVFMGSNEGASETHATVQLKIFDRMMSAIQGSVESALNKAFKIALRMYGIQADVSVTFERLNVAGDKAEQETQAIRIANARNMRDQGWIDQDQASELITDSPAVAEAPDPSVPLVAPIGISGSGSRAAESPKDQAPKARETAQTSPRRITVAQSEAKYNRAEKALQKTVSAGFKQLASRIDGEQITTAFFDREGVPDSQRSNIRIDENSPAYSNALSVVQQFFDDADSRAIITAMSESAASAMVAAYEARAQQIITRLSSSNPNFRYATFRLEDEGQAQLLKDRASLFPQSSFETAKGDIAKTIIRGYRDSKSVGDIATELREKFQELRTTRSELIANTELNWAASHGSLETMRRNNVEKKRWITVGDDRVRPDHEQNERDGDIPVDQAFSGSLDLAPPAGPNCRCTITEVVSDDWLIPNEPWSGS